MPPLENFNKEDILDGKMYAVLAYQFSLGDIPAWAVDEAIKNWYTGKVKDIPEGEFKWCPSPAVLLRASRDILEVYTETAGKIRRLMDAKPLEELLG